MKLIITMSFGVGLFLTQAFGTGIDIMDGAVGEFAATASFFESEVKNTITKVEQALAEVKSNFQDTDSTGSIVSSYKQAAAMKYLKAKVDELEQLLPLYVDSQVKAKQIRQMLSLVTKDSDDESVAE